MAEFHRAHACGLSYADWRLMTRWQVLDHVLRTRLAAQQRAKSIQGKGWRGILGAVVSRILGVG